MTVPKTLKNLLALPTAAFVEAAVMKYVRDACAKLHGVRSKFDRWGNLLVHYRYRPRPVSPLVFSAHSDHPGFIAAEMRDERTLAAAFRGGVYAEFFPGTRVRFFSDGRWIKGRVLELTKTREVYRMIGKMRLPEEALIRVSEPVAPESPGMWDLPEPTIRKGCVHARGCDDIAGCAAMLQLLERLSRRRARADVYCLFTRAEEVGFVGAIGAAKAGTVPKKLPIIAIETSSALPSAPVGEGPILRVGDKASTFTPAVTAFCNRVAQKLAKRRRNFRYQRKLMDGGTCESTAFVAYGYQASGICLALGNYHNMDRERQRIAPEYISLDDYKLMVDWFEALVSDEEGYTRKDVAMVADLEQRFATWLPLLGGPATQEPRAARPRSRPS